jgi:hypothetical protein
MKRRFSIVCLALLLCLRSLAQDQPAPFTLKINTQLVVQTASVTDKDGKPLEGLTKDGFVLTEDNVPQVISVFDFERLEDTALPRPSPERAVERGPARPSQNRITPVSPGDSRYQDRRLLALYFDMPQLGDSERFRAIGAAQTFIDKQMLTQSVHR